MSHELIASIACGVIGLLNAYLLARIDASIARRELAIKDWVLEHFVLKQRSEVLMRQHDPGRF